MVSKSCPQNSLILITESEASLKKQLLSLGDRLVALPGIRNHLFAWTRSKIPIFLLHRAARPEFEINGFDLHEVAAFVDSLRNCGIKIISLEEVVQLAIAGRAPNQPAAVFTSDDGYADQATVLGRAFAERELPLTIFLITDFLDGRDWPWDAKIAHAFTATKKLTANIKVGRLTLDFDLSTSLKKTLARRELQLICKSLSAGSLQIVVSSLFDDLDVELSESPPPQYAPMTWDQARELEKMGVGFAPHSCSHRVLSKLPEDEVRKELADSWDRVSSELSDALKVIAWPIGQSDDFGEKECRIAKSLGFSAAIAARNRYTVVTQETDPFLLDRFGFSTDGTGASAWQIASGIRRVNFRLARSQTYIRRATSPNALGGMAERSMPAFSRRTRAASILSTCAAAIGLYRRPRAKALRETRRIIFVCQGNICRSPYAEALARDIGLPALSCGVRASGTARADEVAARMAFARGVDLSAHRSVNIEQIELGPGDLLLGMEPGHLETLHEVSKRSGAHTSLLGLWSSPKRPWIEDPFALAPKAYERAFALIEASLARLQMELFHLNEMQARSKKPT